MGKVGLESQLRELRSWIRSHSRTESLIRSGVMRLKPQAAFSGRGESCLGMWVVPEVVPLHCCRKPASGPQQDVHSLSPPSAKPHSNIFVFMVMLLVIGRRLKPRETHSMDTSLSGSVSTNLAAASFVCELFACI